MPTILEVNLEDSILGFEVVHILIFGMVLILYFVHQLDDGFSFLFKSWLLHD